MRNAREILRLHFESQLVPGQIASICKVSRSTVQRCLKRLKAAGLSWPLPTDLEDVELERRLYPPPPVASPEERCLPDCGAIHRELKSRKNVTLQLLWEEYKQPIRRAMPTAGTASFTAHGSDALTWCFGTNIAPGKRRSWITPGRRCR